jgi:oxygen-independent coproporphyrinogen-3 oxidase
LLPTCIDIDLIYGIPSNNIEMLEEDLAAAVATGVQHISAYCLTVEKRTALNHFVRIGKLKPPNDDVQSEQFSLMLRFLSACFQWFDL